MRRKMRQTQRKKEADAAKDLAEARKKATEAAEAVSKEALKQASLNRQDAQEARRLAKRSTEKYGRGEKECRNGKKAVFLAQKPELKSVKSKQAKKIQVKWQKIESAEGYEIQYAQNSKFKKPKSDRKKCRYFAEKNRRAEKRKEILCTCACIQQPERNKILH